MVIYHLRHTVNLYFKQIDSNYSKFQIVIILRHNLYGYITVTSKIRRSFNFRKVFKKFSPLFVIFPPTSHQITSLPVYSNEIVGD